MKELLCLLELKLQVLFLAHKAIIRRLNHVHFEGKFSDFLLAILHSVTEKVKIILQLHLLHLSLLELATLDCLLTFSRLKLLCLLSNLLIAISLSCL